MQSWTRNKANMPFTNNLRKDDRVYDKATLRFGNVQMNPRAASLKISVLFDGAKTQKYVPVGDLRLVVDHKVVEDVPPIDGELPNAAPELPLISTHPIDVPARDAFHAGLRKLIAGAIRQDPELFEACVAAMGECRDPFEMIVTSRLSIALLEVTRT